MTRVTVGALEEILGRKFTALDDGFVSVVDYCGGDQAVLDAARHTSGATKSTPQRDEGLIRYLIRKRHSTPLEFASITLHVRAPMDVFRHWQRHRTGRFSSWNESSTRYSPAIDSMKTTKPDEWRKQATSNRQGSGELFAENVGEGFSHQERNLHSHCREVYEARVKDGMALEQARKDLLLCTYSECYWRIDLHNLLHFLGLRTDPHAQLEIREFANIIAEEILPRWAPMVHDAYVDYVARSMTLSSRDISVIQALNAPEEDDAACAEEILSTIGWHLKNSRERKEFEVKAKRLGIEVPWADEDFE